MQPLQHRGSHRGGRNRGEGLRLDMGTCVLMSRKGKKPARVLHRRASTHSEEPVPAAGPHGLGSGQAGLCWQPPQSTSGSRTGLASCDIIS